MKSMMTKFYSLLGRCIRTEPPAEVKVDSKPFNGVLPDYEEELYHEEATRKKTGDRLKEAEETGRLFREGRMGTNAGNRMPAISFKK